MEMPKVGEVVRLNIPQLLEHCAQNDPDELVKLEDGDYCKKTFKLGYPFLRSPADAKRIHAETGKSRYWAEVHPVQDREVRVTSEWYKPSLGPFLVYLVGRGLTPLGVPAQVVESEIDKVAEAKAAKTSSVGGARYKLHAIGNAQNSVVRWALGSLGHEAFTEKDWLTAKARFNHQCVYCSSKRQLVMDHAVPISVQSLGEHRLGNLVPACRTCNAAKGQQRYDDFLRAQPDRADAEARIRTIEEHMAHHGYEALADTLQVGHSEEVRALLQALRLQVAAAATTTVASINDLLEAQDEPLT